MESTTTPNNSPLQLVDNYDGMTEEEFRQLLQGHYPWFIALAFRLVPEIWEWAEEVEEEAEVIAA